MERLQRDAVGVSFCALGALLSINHSGFACAVNYFSDLEQSILGQYESSSFVYTMK